MAQDGFTLKGDKNLERDINNATSYEEIRQLLENSVSRSAIADRDPQTGRFVRRDPLTPSDQVVDPNADGEEQQITKTVEIGGRQFTFTGTEVEVTKAINDVYAVADAGRTQGASQATAAKPRPSTDGLADPIKHAVGAYLESKGVSVDELAAQSWSAAVETFLRSSDGADWPGGTQNLNIIGTQIIAMGLENAEDKRAALATAWAEMKKKQMVFETGPSEADLLAETESLTPQQIIERWKQSFENADDANASFMRQNSSTGSSSSLFGK